MDFTIKSHQVLESHNERLRFSTTVQTISISDIVAMQGKPFTLSINTKRLDDGSWEVIYDFNPVPAWMESDLRQHFWHLAELMHTAEYVCSENQTRDGDG